MMPNKKTKSLGFTLIELLVVVAIIGLLSSMVLVSVKTARENAQEKKNMQFSASIYHSLGAYAIGIWHFDGDFQDSSGNGIYTEWYGPGAYVTGIMNKAVDLYSAEDPMYIESSSKLKNKSGQFTIEFWINVRYAGTSGQLIFSQNGYYGNYPLDCSLSTSSLYCYLEDTDWNYVEFAKNYTTKKWNHVVLTYDGDGYAQMFFNGEEVAPDGGGPFYDIYTTEADIEIGGWSGLNVYFDEFRIYDSYITISEARKRYAEGLMKIGLAEYSKKYE